MHLYSMLAVVLIGTCSATPISLFRGAFMIETSDSFAGLHSLDLKSHFGCTLTPRLNFTSTLFRGSSFDAECSGPENNIVTLEIILDEILLLPSVTHAWSLDQTNKPRNPLPILRQRAPRSRGNNGPVALRTPSLDALSHKRQNDPVPFAPHVSTGIDRVHASGVYGSGIRIAVIDSGFDLSVPGLANTHVAYTYDYTDDDSDVADKCSYHGTHILGVLGASSDNNEFGVIGAAPNATYELYRIQTCSGSAPTDILIAAFLDAAERNVDVISCSFGGMLQYPEEPLSLVASRIHANGTFVVTSAGNGGPGVFSAASPGGAQLISSAGSADNAVTPYYTWGANLTDTSKLRFVPGSPFAFPSTNKLTVWFPGSAENLEARCNPLPNGTEFPSDPANTILLIDFSHCWLDPGNADMQITQTLSIPYVMYYQPAQFSTVSDGLPFIPTDATSNYTGVVTISNTDAQVLVRKISQGIELQVSIPANVADSDMQVRYQNNTRSGDLSSSFSSWGPTLDGRTMPTILGPGGNIMSTLPSFLGDWGVLSGTSQATPLIAGVAALLIEMYPTLRPVEIQNIISSTAKPVKWNDGEGVTLEYLAPVFQQGAGLIDAWAAINVVSRVNTSSLNFNDTANRPPQLAFTLSNAGNTVAAYTLVHVGAASGYILSNASAYSFSGAEARPVYAEVAISPETITLQPGANVDVLVQITADPNLPETTTRGSFFGGYISINSSSDSEVISIPYTGFGSALKSLPMINRNATFSAAANESLVINLEDDQTFDCFYNVSIPTGSPVACSGGLFPGYRLTFMLPTRSYIFDIVQAENITVVALSNSSSGGPTSPWIDNSYWYWDGTDADRAFLPAGKYIWRVTALKFNGDVGKVEDYDVWYGKAWTLQYSIDSILPV